MGNFYCPDDKGEVVSCAGQFFYIVDKNMTKFQQKSTKYPFMKGYGLPGRVWDSKNYEWCPNV